MKTADPSYHLGWPSSVGLSCEVCDAWVRYCAVEAGDLHAARKARLFAFLDAIDPADLALKDAFATLWCTAVLDSESTDVPPIRVPALQRFVADYLKRGRAQRSGQHTRWLAQLCKYQASSTVEMFFGEFRTTGALLEEALSYRFDERTAHLLVIEHMETVAFGLHELPLVVLEEAQIRDHMRQILELSDKMPWAEHAMRFVQASDNVLADPKNSELIEAYRQISQLEL